VTNQEKFLSRLERRIRRGLSVECYVIPNHQSMIIRASAYYPTVIIRENKKIVLWSNPQTLFSQELPSNLPPKTRWGKRGAQKQRKPAINLMMDQEEGWFFAEDPNVPGRIEGGDSAEEAVERLKTSRAEEDSNPGT
jgi:hypothetical protein